VPGTRYAVIGGISKWVLARGLAKSCCHVLLWRPCGALSSGGKLGHEPLAAMVLSALYPSDASWLMDVRQDAGPMLQTEADRSKEREEAAKVVPLVRPDP
jgi:hypothetical protein